MPRLREFDLDLPEAGNAERQAFRAESRAVTSLFERCFEGLTDCRGWKVLIECVSQVTKPHVRDLLGVLTLQIQADAGQLTKLESREKKEAHLNLLHMGVLAVARAEGWRSEPFEIARRCVLERQFVNAWWWRTPRWSPTKGLEGRVWCEHETDAFRAWLVIFDKSGDELARHQVLETAPSEFAFDPKLGEARWTSNRRFALVAKDAEEVGALIIPG